MAKYRKKPVVVEAEQWEPGKDVAGVVPMFYCHGLARSENRRDHYDCRAEYPVSHPYECCDNCKFVLRYRKPTFGQIETLEGTLAVSSGDWIITGVHGEKYPCKPDIFEKTYELIEDENDSIQA